MNKPVYTKVISCGTPPNAGEKSIYHNLGAEEMLSVSGYFSDGAASYTIPYVISDGGLELQVTNDSIRMKTYADWSGYSDTMIQLKYTKI